MIPKAAMGGGGLGQRDSVARGEAQRLVVFCVRSEYSGRHFERSYPMLAIPLS